MIDRYADESIGSIWNRQAELDRWVRIEIAAMRNLPLAGDAWTILSVVPTPAAEAVAAAERDCDHEVVAFLQVWHGLLTPKEEYPSTARLDQARRWLHYGLTSSDLVDSGLGMALDASASVILERSGDLYDALRLMIGNLDGLRQIGRTHGQWAVIRPLTHPWEVATSTLSRMDQRLQDLRPELAVGKLSGPVGTTQSSHLNRALQELGLHPVRATQIVPRDHVAAFAALLADLATFCEGIATQVRLLSQSGVAEVSEGKQPRAVGSSAMPAKRNPILSENICGLARLARAAESPLRLGLVQWYDRDLAHSSVERVALPDLLHLCATILRRTRRLVSGLVWNQALIAGNRVEAEELGVAHAYERVMVRQAAGEDYLTAHRAVTEEMGG